MTVLFPGYRRGPNGERELFLCAEDVPEGWTRDHPSTWPGGVFPGTAKPAGQAPEPKRDPFDHDGDGKPGGSLPGKRRSRKVKPDGPRK